VAALQGDPNFGWVSPASCFSVRRRPSYRTAVRRCWIFQAAPGSSSRHEVFEWIRLGKILRSERSQRGGLQANGLTPCNP
jgi:hypothetical protein